MSNLAFDSNKQIAMTYFSFFLYPDALIIDIS